MSDQGEVYAQLRPAQMYANGDGAPAILVPSKLWLQEMADNGSELTNQSFRCYDGQNQEISRSGP